ncbi:insulinase family protein [candidate division KSB1 bacterium]|nr:insulinase family protein [candidate division KSB1 bacterium]
MRNRKSVFALLFAIVTVLLTNAMADDVFKDIEIPYEKFVLKNGLTLIVHEDHKAPIVAVNVWYHVGSKNEKPGRTGFAHLFEHLMFNGSENFNDDYFQALERVGATDLNGTTSEDRTNYFQNVPTSALDIALWMESDRMGHMIGAIDQAKLDEQRGVVQNEKRQYENEPYGLTYELITKATFPEGHPYSWTVIGSMEDLNAASLEDVHEWFKTYYGASNAVLCIAGDIDAQTAKEKVEKYFGGIAPGPPVAKHDVWIARRTGEHRQKMQDRVPQARIYKVWNMPHWGSKDADYLNLVSDVLALGKTSRLYKRLVYDEQIATDVSAYVDLREIAGLFQIQATVKPGKDMAEVEKAIDEELDRLLREGPTEKELKRVKTQYFSRFVRGIERIGGFGGKSDILIRNEVFGGSPDYYKKTLDHMEKATTQDLHAAARRWLSDGVYVLEVHPYPDFAAAETDVDRSKLPVPGTPPVAEFPELQRKTLSNGLEIVLAERPSIPVVNFDLLINAGYAADQFALPGTANLAMNMLDEGTKKRSALEISEDLAMLGASISSGSNLDFSVVSLSTLKSTLDDALELYAEVILEPSFPQSDFERLKKQQLASIQREKSSPFQMALRVFPQLIYGNQHAYGLPFTGSGFEESVSNMKRNDLVKFHQTWFKPNNATMIVVGAARMDEISSKLEKLFKNWESGDVPQKNIAKVEQKEEPVVYLLDKPGAIQSVVFAGHVAPPKGNPDEIAIETMNYILGGSFTSRINMNLREDKHWTYGARSVIVDARGQRPFLAYTSVQTDKTKETMIEISKELTGILNEEPATEEELSKAQKNKILRLPGSWETINEVAGSIRDIVRFELDDNYYQSYPGEIRALKVATIASAAKKVLHPDHLVWIVVGDRNKIEDSIRELGYSNIHVIDTDGKILEK